jgi:hypothetical protein
MKKQDLEILTSRPAATCLKCNDSGVVVILDPRAEPEPRPCPNGCKPKKTKTSL